jgi:hypothetical protein
MNGTADMGGAGTYGNTEADEAGALDPESASRLLTQTQRQAQRSLDFRSPWLTLIAAAVAFWAARSAVREDWMGLGVSVAVMLVGAVSALAGPRGMWLSDGIGLCVVLLGYTAVEAGLVHAPRSGT